MYRGFILKCQFCRTTDWFSVSEARDDFQCKRCRREQKILSKHTLGLPELTWHYALDEIVYQGMLNNMLVPILALSALRQKASSFFYVDEIDLLDASNQLISEIDICCVRDGVLTIGEAKLGDRLEASKREEIRSLAKYRRAAEDLGARRFVLATSQKRWSPQTVGNVQNVFRATSVEIGFLEGDELFRLQERPGH